MALWHLPRASRNWEPPIEDPEAEASPQARRCLEKLDERFVETALQLGVSSGEILDIGTGSGQVPIQLALRNEDLIIHALDHSEVMLRRVALDAGRWGVDLRILVEHGDARALPYESGIFDMVLCSFVLHQVESPVALIREMGRVCKAGGALLLRDHRRPSRWGLGWHLWRHGRHFRGSLREEFEASVRSACTRREIVRIMRESGVPGIRFVSPGPGQVGFLRRAGAD